VRWRGLLWCAVAGCALASWWNGERVLAVAAGAVTLLAVAVRVSGELGATRQMLRDAPAPEPEQRRVPPLEPARAPEPPRPPRPPWDTAQMPVVPPEPEDEPRQVARWQKVASVRMPRRTAA
jgi:hypothetical protein